MATCSRGSQEVAEPLRLRAEAFPEQLVVVRLGATALADRRLSDACDRSYERWGAWGFSVVGGSGRGRLPEAGPSASRGGPNGARSLLRTAER